MKEAKTKSSLPIIITLVLSGLVMVLGNGHCCHLHSAILEVLLPIAVISGACFWTSRARTRGKAWIRTVLSLVIAVSVQTAYLTWLHTTTFPDFLLSKYTKEEQAKIDAMRKRIRRQRAGEATSDSAPGAERGASQP